MKIKGITRQTLVLGVTPMLVSFIALFSFFLSARLEQVDLQLQDKGRFAAEQLALANEFAVFTADKSSLTRILTSVIDEDFAYIEVTDREGQRLAYAANYELSLEDVLIFQQAVYQQSLPIKEDHDPFATNILPSNQDNEPWNSAQGSWCCYGCPVNRT